MNTETTYTCMSSEAIVECKVFFYDDHILKGLSPSKHTIWMNTLRNSLVVNLVAQRKHQAHHIDHQ